MFLAVDIGNSNIVLATWNGQQWSHKWRIETHPVRSAKDYVQQFSHLLSKAGCRSSDITSLAVSSVVPSATPSVMEAIEQLFKVEPYLLKAAMQDFISVEREDPAKVGTDLIADAAGAYTLVGDNCITVDFGTATTVMAVQNPGILYGGAVCAGLKVTADALIERAAQLEEIPLEPPPSVVGQNAVETLQSGLVFGHLCMVEGLIDRMKKELGPAKVVATGGLASTLAPYTHYFDYVEPMLTLNGLRYIADKRT